MEARGLFPPVVLLCRRPAPSVAAVSPCRGEEAGRGRPRPPRLPVRGLRSAGRARRPPPGGWRGPVPLRGWWEPPLPPAGGSRAAEGAVGRGRGWGPAALGEARLRYLLSTCVRWDGDGLLAPGFGQGRFAGGALSSLLSHPHNPTLLRSLLVFSGVTSQLWGLSVS